MYIELDDLRQSYVVAKNEILKSIRSKRFTLYVLFIAAVFTLITTLQHFFGGGFGETPGEVIAIYVQWVYFMIILAATLFASVAISSEFEERTALILFTRPIKKTSIFLGKILGCIILETTMIAMYYLGMVIVSLIASGSMPGSSILTSLGIAFMFIIAATAIAIMMSSIMRRGIFSAIFVFVLFLLILPIISGVISVNMDPWFMIDQATDSIATCIEEYVDLANELLQRAAEITGMSTGAIVSADIPRTIITMVGWSAVSLILAWFAFIRREF